MASIQKRGSKWFAQICMQGVRKSASFPTKSQANAWATHTESEILAGKHKEKSNKTLLEALERYASEVSPTKRGVRWELIRLNAWKRLITNWTTSLRQDWQSGVMNGLKHTVNLC